MVGAPNLLQSTAGLHKPSLPRGAWVYTSWACLLPRVSGASVTPPAVSRRPPPAAQRITPRQRDAGRCARYSSTVQSHRIIAGDFSQTYAAFAIVDAALSHAWRTTVRRSALALLGLRWCCIRGSLRISAKVHSLVEAPRFRPRHDVERRSDHHPGLLAGLGPSAVSRSMALLFLDMQCSRLIFAFPVLPPQGS